MGDFISHQRIPIVVLGGSDRRSTRMPDSGRELHPLSTVKGVDILIDGRPIIERIVGRLIACDRFDPVVIAGPAAVYQTLRTGARLLDTDGTFGENIRNSLEAVRRDHPGAPVSFITCDILPEVETLTRLMDLYWDSAPCDLWFPLVRAPENPAELGQFAWKPTYRIVPSEGEPAMRILPGHWVIADPEALRREFLYRLFQVGYMTRNRSIDRRRSAMVRRLLLALVGQDLRHLAAFRLPTLTWSVLRAGIPAAAALRNGTITRERLEAALRKIFARYRHRRAHPERHVRIPIVDELSLALDVDTEEEARQLGGRPRAVSGQ